MSAGISDELRARVRRHARDACTYCRSPQRLVLGPLELDHIVPKARGGTDDEENLCLACRLCNSYKGTLLEWSASGVEVVGRTATGRATVAALQRNNVLAVMVRRSWVVAGWHPPAEKGAR